MAAPDTGAFHLLALPSDVLLTVLQQPCLGPRELCRLELCCTAISQLIDDTVWRQTFLLHRRTNALREPENWKQEYARRDQWSRSWRQLITNAQTPCPSMQRLGGHTQKLRRFALKMMSGSPPPPPPPQFATHIVDQRSTDPRHSTTITAAIAKAKPFDVLLVEPGIYHERLRIDKPLEIIGMGPIGSTCVIGAEGPSLEAASRVACRIAKMRIEQRANGDGGAMSGAVLIKGGAMLILEESVVTSETGHCVVLQVRASPHAPARTRRMPRAQRTPRARRARVLHAHACPPATFHQYDDCPATQSVPLRTDALCVD